MKVGTQVLFDGDGLLFKILSTALSLFDPYYRNLKPKPWHTGFISRWHPTLGWMICESMAGGVQENPLAIYDSRYYKFYEWFDKPLDEEKVTEFLKSHLGLKYDVVGYVWIAIATLIGKVFHRNIGVWHDENYLCWELLEEFNECMGKPFCKENRTLTISDICKALM